MYSSFGFLPPSVYLRKCRKYTKLSIFLLWLWFRIIYPTNNCGVGLLDKILSFLAWLVSVVLMWIKERHYEETIVQPVTSAVLLCLNDFLGVRLIQVILEALHACFFCNYSLMEWKDEQIQSLFDFASENVSFVKRGLLKEETKMELQLRESLWGQRNKQVTKVLPSQGMDPSRVVEYLEGRARIENTKWQEGYVSGAVYSGEKSHVDILSQVYNAFSLSNPLHPDIWPTVNQCEAEVVSMTANLLNGGDPGVVGSTTSGGTESIIMAVRAHLNMYGKKRSITKPEIIAGTTAHAGLDKACDMFGIRLIKVPCDEKDHFCLTPKSVLRRMSSNVIMIYASAPSFPQGTIDPIGGLSHVAQLYDVGLHVDACLGGFVLPFARKLNMKEIPIYDFECNGVTSISADVHKFGYGSKGISVILYRNKDLRRAQYFTYSKWTGGLYVTPTIAGSRPGALLACAWASLVTIGEDGFMKRTKIILDAAKEINLAVSRIEGLRVLGSSAIICCFTSSDDRMSIYQVGDAMAKKGWSLNSLQNPAAIHICCTLQTDVTKFINDLTSVVKTLKCEQPKGSAGSTAAIYGMATSLPAGPVNQLLKVYTDVSLDC